MDASSAWNARYFRPVGVVCSVFFVATLTAILLTVSPPEAVGQSRPNIIVIMADDLGAEGLGSYGNTLFTTPNLDKMAEEGARFENAYATPLCTPTRVMLMTGQYPNRTGFTNLISNTRQARMPESLKTFGSYFKEAGYRTAVVGKWQLGQLDQFSAQPAEHGFDEYCLWKRENPAKALGNQNRQKAGHKTKAGIKEGGAKTGGRAKGGVNEKHRRYFSPRLWCNGVTVEGGKNDFGPDLFLDFVLRFIENNRDGPFLVYYPMAMVHKPLVTPPGYGDLARSKYVKGIGKKTAQFGHMVTYMDMMVGRILQKVKDLGIDDNTLIIFTGDNGSPNEVMSRLGNIVVPGGKGTKTEAGTRVPFIARWPGTIPEAVRTPFISLVDVLPTIASLAHIEVDDDVDGWDLSHNLFGTQGKDRDHVFFAFKDDFWIRDKTYRFHNDGTLLFSPVASNKTRYRTKVRARNQDRDERQRLRALLDMYKRTIPAHDAGSAIRLTKRQRMRKKAARARRRRLGTSF